MKTLFKNAYILIREENSYKVLSNAYLLVNDDLIQYIGLDKPTGPVDKEIDATNKLLMPGLINAHGHVVMSLLRGQGSGKSFQDWLYKSIWPIEDRLTKEDGYTGALLSSLEISVLLLL